MKKQLLSVLFIYVLLAFWSIPIQGQLSKPILPKSYSAASIKADVPTKTMSSVDVAKARVEDAVKDLQPGTPWRFALPIAVNLNLKNSGTWEQLPDGSRVWRLRIDCPGAISVNFLYSDFFLPEGATLHLYTPDRKQLRGAFTSQNNKPDRKMATALMMGESVVLEYYEPAKVQGQGSLAISTVNHGYRGYGEANAHLGNSGSCQVDVNCSEGNAWQTIKKSVAKYTRNGSAWCSGALINNSAQDCRPLFLTANHCAEPIPLDAINSPTTGSTLVFYWNFERSGCNDGSAADDTQTTTGASILANPLVNGAHASSSDFALYLLTENPFPTYDVYFAGFNASGGIGSGSVGIHHPSGDAKKIATDGDSPTSVVNNFYWRIYWDQTANGWSVTEGGSSGSPLFNANGQIIGQLFGGFDGGQPNCSDPANDEGDYGKLSYSWTNGGAGDSRRRLWDHLDPVGSGANTVIAGSANPCVILANDLCANALPISCGGSVSGNTDSATPTDSPNVNCGTSSTPVSKGIWYRLTGDDSYVTLSMCSGTNFDSKIQVFSGSCGALSCIAGNDDFCSTFGPSEVSFAAQAGTSYYIYVFGFIGATGDFTLTATCCDLPEAKCKNHTVQLDDTGSASILASNVNNGSTVDCGQATLTVTPNSFNCSNVGDNLVTLTITDIHGNSDNCTATVKVEDNVAPDAVCKDITVQLDANGDGSIIASDVDGGSTDACGIASISATPTTFNCSNVGPNNVVLTVNDVNGNSNTCDATVTVEDNIPPVITLCVGNSIDFNGEDEILSSLGIDFDATDACGIASITYDPEYITCDQLGSSVPVTVTATDNNGNPSSCVANVLVTGLPCGWMDFGDDGIGCTDSNDASYDVPSETFTLVSEGCYSTNFGADDAAYVKYELCGDGEIIAHVGSINPLAQGWAGISARESNAPGSKKVALSTNLSNFGRREVRTTTNGYAFPQQFFRPGATWLKLVRNGHQFTGYMSVNGINWQLVMAANVPMTNCIQFGLFLTNYNGSTVTATFDNVEVTESGILPFSTPEIGAGETDVPYFDAEDFSIFPNPAKEQVHLDLINYYGKEVQVEILNQLGQPIQQRRLDEVGSSPEQFDVNTLSSGTYFIRITTNKGDKVKKFLIIK
ncbi:MAG: hypothetical protein DHS20C18_12910 [Saprospiraceae bacterium]|nr:MAG: hypothetical protein DHS20C18_12910 [Saprospiraceae bacterium]